jgi:hypothetical protein
LDIYVLTIYKNIVLYKYGKTNNFKINLRMKMFYIKTILYHRRVKMKKNGFIFGLLALLLVFGLVLVGCGDGAVGGGDDGNGNLHAELKNADRIKVYTGIDSLSAGADYSTDLGSTAFSVTVGGSQQQIESILMHSSYGDAFDINLVSNVPGTGEILVSYDGTGYFAGKVAAFTNLAVSR